MNSNKRQALGDDGDRDGNDGHARVHIAGRREALEYPFRLSLYDKLPRVQLDLNSFETFALDRLKVLRAIENAAVRNKSAVEMAAVIKAATDKYMRMDPNSARAMAGSKTLEDQRRKDHLSHFILRLAFCRTEDNRSWFMNHETLLFKYRFESEFQEERSGFLKFQQLNAAPISKQERETLFSELRSLFPTSYDQPFFKVPFEQVLPLVSRRAVVLKAGFAFVPETEQSTLVTNAFNKHLLTSLDTFSRSLPRMDEDDRLIPILNSIARQCASRDYTMDPNADPKAQILASEIDSLAAQGHFPLCMTNLHTHLRADSHLKHGGRLQFGLFLKGCGVSMEEALLYWRKAFNKLAADKFDKEYAYNIRFNYGKEGSRKDYAPYSCSKIIMSNPPSAGDHHGCPFRHSPPDALRSMVAKVAGEGVAVDVMRLAKEGHYQIACTRLFEATRVPAIRAASRAKSLAAAAGSSGSGESGDSGKNDLLVTNEGVVEVIEHPNQWFDLSYRGSDSGKHRGVSKKDDNMDVDR
ncbi:DNA primase large subunit [Chytriomyces hyalinus]|nr:DNA primase large subunit [Chytriomyces hyalinus]